MSLGARSQRPPPNPISRLGALRHVKDGFRALARSLASTKAQQVRIGALSARARALDREAGRRLSGCVCGRAQREPFATTTAPLKRRRMDSSASRRPCRHLSRRTGVAGRQVVGAPTICQPAQCGTSITSAQRSASGARAQSPASAGPVHAPLDTRDSAARRAPLADNNDHCRRRGRRRRCSFGSRVYVRVCGGAGRCAGCKRRKSERPKTGRVSSFVCAATHWKGCGGARLPGGVCVAVCELCL